VFFVSFMVNFSRLSMKEQRKTLEQREQMTDLEQLRPSASHVLAAAILKIRAADCSAAQEFYAAIAIRG